MGEFNGMSSQSHVSHCRALPLGEFTVTIPEPHATLQGAVTWRNQCRNHATLQGVRIPSAIMKIVFRHILFFVLFLMQFRRAAAFVSSPIHLFFFYSTKRLNLPFYTKAAAVVTCTHYVFARPDWQTKDYRSKQARTVA